MAVKIRSGDEVIILSGKYKGKRGKVKKKIDNNKIIVEGINLIKKHQKAVPSLNRVGGIIIRESALQISNVAIINSSTGKADRIGFKFIQGKKVRYLKSNKENIRE
ncbi:MAG: 50S ribosomal protein L24 [Candidatus Dasytiphilus stammeri]